MEKSNLHERYILMIPGPTNLEPSVLRVLSKPPMSHTSSDFAKIFSETLDMLKKLMMTSNDVFVISGSGTLAMEMAIANVIEKDDEVLIISNGFFGERIREIVRRHEGKEKCLLYEWGESIDFNDVENALRHGNFKAMAVVHVDTSTGIANPIEELGKLARKYDALFIVDSVSSLGGMEVKVDDWGIDLCISGSQKALESPPGLSIISASEKALEARENRKEPVRFFYGDLKEWIKVMHDPTQYFSTHPVNLIYALNESLKLVLNEGLERRFQRHHLMAKAVWKAIENMGLKILVEKDRSHTVSVINYPVGIVDEEFRKIMAEKWRIIVARGQERLRGKAFRIGHMGNVNAIDIASTLNGIEATLKELGYKVELGSASAAFNEVFSSLKL
ncbi:MAG: alanine--glyoxylate aminotransferase family protein [Candidatus Bathyarchaeia archaeon]